MDLRLDSTPTSYYTMTNVHSRRQLRIIIWSTIFTLLCGASALADNGAFYITKWGRYGSGIGEFSSPSGVAIDEAGYIYIVDRGNNRIVRRSPFREPDVTWGTTGSSSGQFMNPQGIAVDPWGNVFVADTDNNRIQWFNSSGAFIARWGSLGTSNGKFNKPFGVAVKDHHIYVTDGENHRVQDFQYTREYTAIFIDAWGTQGTGNGQFKHPGGIALDSNGNIYVADTDNHRIEKFNASHDYTQQWGSYGQTDGQFSYPKGIAIDGNGALYVADVGNNRIQKFISQGFFVGKWGTFGTAANQFYFPTFVAVGTACSIVVSDTSNHRVQKFASDNSNFNTKWGAPGTGAGQFTFSTDYPTGIAVDSKGFVYVLEPAINRLQKFSSTGENVWQIGGYGGGQGQFYYPVGVAVDSADNLYVVETGNGRVQKFNSNGGYLTEWSLPFGTYPLRIATDSNDGVYVVLYPNSIYKYDSSGGGGHSLLAPNYTDPQGNSKPLNPESIAVNIANYDVTFYVASGYTYPNNIVQFNSPDIGSPWGFPARSLSTDTSSLVYAVDTEANIIRRFTPSGTLLNQWGSSGTGNGRFSSPDGIAVDRNGNIYVVDVGNNRIQKFSTVPGFTMPIS